MEFAQLTKD